MTREKYPPRTIKEMVSSMQHYYQVTLKRETSLFVGQEFKEMREVLDATMKNLARYQQISKHF